MKTLIIVRHGNTFLANETPTRVGAKTDIPLVEEKRGRSIGKYLLEHNVIPDKIYAAPLLRTMQTANLVVNEMQLNVNVVPNSSFTEIDYGVDENKTEEQVKLRLGKQYAQDSNIQNPSVEDIMAFGNKIIDLWNSQAIVPKGWQVDVDKIILSWINFSENIDENETVLICSSNGIIRFAPYILGEAANKEFQDKYDLKVATGSVSVFTNEINGWHCKEWNTKPYKLY